MPSTRRVAAPLPPLPCACATVRRAMRAISQLYDTELRSTGLTLAQFTLLQFLATAGRTRQSEIGEMLALDPTTLSRTLRPLLAEGWIGIRPGRDRRERYVEATGAGARKLAEAAPHWERTQARLRRSLGRGGWDALFDVLTRATRAARSA